MAKTDVVNSICKGEEKRFRGEVCEYYDQNTKECTLLRDEPLRVVFEKGRCQPFENIVRKRVIKYLREFKYQESLENMTRIAESIAEQYIKPARLRVHTLPALLRFIGTIVFRKVIDRLEEEGILPKKECGACRHLSQTEPHFCERAMLIINEQEIPNPHYRETRNPSDYACKHGFEPYKFQSIESLQQNRSQPQGFLENAASSAHNDVTDFHVRVWVEHHRFLLKERQKQATGEKRKIYRRQRSVFLRLTQLILGEGKTRSEAIVIIARELGYSRKQIRRDVDALEEFLRAQNVSYASRPGTLYKEESTQA